MTLCTYGHDSMFESGFNGCLRWICVWCSTSCLMLPLFNIDRFINASYGIDECEEEACTMH
jgi:hypothetical protein